MTPWGSNVFRIHSESKKNDPVGGRTFKRGCMTAYRSTRALRLFKVQSYDPDRVDPIVKVFNF
jgi:hypothetical protein